MAIIVEGFGFGHPGMATLFWDVDFGVATAEHAALIGDNGVGKSTLLRILIGEEQEFEGRVQIDGSVGYMPQHIGPGVDLTVRELLARGAESVLRDAAGRLAAAIRIFVIAQEDDPEGELGLAYAAWGDAGGWQAEAQWDTITRRVLGQDFDTAADRPVRELSGGERKRLLLEALLRSSHPNLLLDEPDNFLDLAGKAWLAEQVRRSNKTILVVSHDRQFLTGAVTKLITVESTGAWIHGGTYATYEDARTARIERLAANLQDWKEEERRLYHHMRWMKQRAAINDGAAPAADAAETRWKKFVEQGPPPPPPRVAPVKMRIVGAQSGRQVLVCKGVAIPGLVQSFNLEIFFGERVLLLGPNGTGKTHLQEVFAGRSEEYAGSLRFGARVHPSYFHQLDERPEFTGKNLLEVLYDAGLTEDRAYSLLTRYGIVHAARNPYETLSGGQRARLQIALLEVESKSLLVLDEPTDNLDLQSAEALENALDSYEGTVICVTHDRWFMRKFTRFLLLDRDGRLFDYPDLESVLGALLPQEQAAVGKPRDLSA